jgi:hypothetical protein
MYTNVEQIPDEVINLPLGQLLCKAEKWNIPRKNIMKKRRLVKSRIYTRKSRIFRKIELDKRNEKLEEIKKLEEENQHLKVMLKQYDLFINEILLMQKLK